jgi:addiction module HigA family antidote
MKKIPFAYSIHPGEILKTEFMEPLGLSSYRLAKYLHVSAPRVNDTAMRLSAYFGNSAEFWLGLQMDHDLWIAAKDKSLAKVMPLAQAA